MKLLKNQRLLALIILTLTAALDQLTKLYVVRNWAFGSVRVVIPDFFHLVHVTNTGAAWGILSGQPVLLGFISLSVLCLAFWKFPTLTEGRSTCVIAMGLVLGGTYGNLIDRFCRGEVVDFLLFFYRGFYWPAFNVADSAICIGVAVFLWASITADRKEQQKTPPIEPAAEAHDKQNP